MKLNLNKARDLDSISALPPRRTSGSGGGPDGASASASAAAASQQRSQTMSQQSFSQGGGSGGASFSQGVGSGGASFSQGRGGGGGGVGALFSQGGGGGGALPQGRGGGGAPFSQNSSGGDAVFSQGGGGGGASFSQGGEGRGAAFSQGGGGGGGGGGAAFSQGGSGGSASFSQGVGGASLLHWQAQISQDQRFALPDESSKRMASFPASSASVVREEPQLQQAKISSNCNPIHRRNHSLPDSRCQMNEDVELKYQHLASSVHKIGMVLDSVQNDLMQLSRAMKEASLECDSIQKKFVLVENSVQQILKGQDDLKALLEGSTKSNPDLLSVLNYHTSKLDEISLTLAVLKQVPADLRQLKGGIFRILTKEMEGIVRAIRSLSGRPDPMQMLADQRCTTNEKPMMNGTPVAKGGPQMKEGPVADGRPPMKETPVANGRSQMNQTPAANGISKMKHAPEANGKPLMKQIPVAKALPATVLISRREVEDLKSKVEQGLVVKVPANKAPCSIIIDLDEEEEEEEGSDGSASCVILNAETGKAAEPNRTELN